MTPDPNTRLDSLKRQREALDKEIAEAEKLEKKAETNRVLAACYLHVACASCNGEGVTYAMGSDNMDLDDWPCEDCKSRGYLWARRWDGKKNHDMDHNEVFPA